MMTLANYGIKSAKQKDPNSAKVLSKSLQIRNRAELLLKQCFKTHYRVTNDKRNDIFNLINDYYSRIHFDALIWNKYEVKQCISDSILFPREKFNPYKAREAFIIVENMLINLVLLPWHSEFRKIHLYSGNYRLYLDKPIVGIERIFRAAGFQEDPGDPLHLKLPDRMMPQIDDGESVTSVIFDLMLAQVVCSNVIDVYEKCFKAAKPTNTDNTTRMTSDEMLNCYPWMQEYFQERTCQTTERACENIHNSLNNLTFNLSKFSPSKLLVDRMSVNNHDRDNSDIATAAREKTRGFLAQQVKDNDSLVTSLSNDLLRLPTNLANHAKNTPLDLPDSSSGSSFKINQTSNEHANSNGYILDRYSMSEPHKVIAKTSIAPYGGGSNHHHHHLFEIDNPHNDRELLLPKYADRQRHHQQPLRHDAGHSTRPTNLYNNHNHHNHDDDDDDDDDLSPRTFMRGHRD